MAWIFCRRRVATATSGCRDAISLLEPRVVDGRWPLQNTWPGKVFFPPKDGGRGRPSRWNTLRALRVLRWWHGDVGWS